MDGGPFRVPRPAERRVSGRPESAAPRRAEPANEQQVAEEKPKATHRSAATSQRSTAREKQPRRRVVKPILLAILAVAIIVIGWLGWSSMQSTGMAIDSSKYQAVSISDGQIYFGKLSVVDNEFVKLTNAYYLQAQPADATDESKGSQQSPAQGDVKLIKLANKIYGPENEIVIAKSQVLSYENLLPDGQVAKWLKDNADQ